MSPTATGPVLVLLDHSADGALRPVVAELVTAARTLGEVHGAWLDGASGGPGGTAGEPSTEVIGQLGALGVAQVHVVTTDADVRLTPVAAEALTALVGEIGAAVLVVVSSFENKEAVARVGVATGAGVIVDGTGVQRLDGRVVVDKTVLAGTWTTRCAIRTPLAVVGLKAGAVQAASAEHPTTPELVRHAPVIGAGARTATVVEHSERAPSGRPALGEAQVVVAGGRGTEGDFSAVEELADALGAAVGATRVATDEGWIGHDAQIGQTGVTIAPRLYIGAGISGAVHHRGGMQASGTIVAVNADPEAPIFEIADLGIVGDLFSVLPQAAAELRRRTGAGDGAS